MNLNELKSVKSAQPTFPLNFSVATEDDRDLSPVLYIENIDNAHDLHWNILNEGTEELFIEQKTGLPSIDNFHFQLRVRPGTLSRNFISTGTPAFITNKQDATWKIQVTEDSTSKIVYISLLATEIPAGRLIITPHAPLQVIIKKVNADPVGGARNTNVELVYQSIYNSATNPLNGNRMQHLGIVNHQGVKNIPLLVETLGSAIVLNTGEKNDLSVQISNYSWNTLPLLHDVNKASTIEVIIHSPLGDESGELFLAPMDNLKEIELLWKDLTNWRVGPREENPDSVSWTIINERMAGIDKGQSLSFDLNNIVTTFPEGMANVQINYANFPGYWDGTLHLGIAKSPINFKNKNVGIHTNDPKHLLDVRGEGGFNKLVITKNDGTAYANNGINMDNTIGDNLEYLRINGIAGADQNSRIALVADITKILCNLLDVKGVVSAKAFHDEHGPLIPSGVIVAWHGSADTIPQGWSLCNGENGTPNLQERFIFGTGRRGPAPGTVGGSSTIKLTTAQLPIHSHNIAFTMADVRASWSGKDYWPVNPDHRNNGTWDKDTDTTGEGKPFDSMPPYFSLCYIMKL